MRDYSETDSIQFFIKFLSLVRVDGKSSKQLIIGLSLPIRWWNDLAFYFTIC